MWTMRHINWKFLRNMYDVTAGVDFTNKDAYKVYVNLHWAQRNKPLVVAATLGQRAEFERLCAQNPYIPTGEGMSKLWEEYLSMYVLGDNHMQMSVRNCLCAAAYFEYLEKPKPGHYIFRGEWPIADALAKYIKEHAEYVNQPQNAMLQAPLVEPLDQLTSARLRRLCEGDDDEEYYATETEIADRIIDIYKRAYFGK